MFPGYLVQLRSGSCMRMWTLVGTWTWIHLVRDCFRYPFVYIHTHIYIYVYTNTLAQIRAHRRIYFVIRQHQAITCRRFLIIPCSSRATSWNRHRFAPRGTYTSHHAVLSVSFKLADNQLRIRSYMDCRAPAKLVHLRRARTAWYTSWLAFT